MNNTVMGMDKSGSYRVYLTVTTEMVEEARHIHGTTPLATAGLGRVLTAAGMMGLMLKNQNDKMTLLFKGDGPAKQIMATADGKGHVKGYIADPHVELPLTKEGKLDVGGSLGIGELTVIKDMGMGEPYVGTIALVNGEIAEDLTAYFLISEQQSTSVALGVKVERDLSVGAAGGMIIQMLPGADEGAVEVLEERIKAMPPLTALIEDALKEGAGQTMEGILDRLLDVIFGELPDGYQVDVLDHREISWDCDCNRERLEKALLSIGEKDLREILEEDGQAELQCQFCLKKYHFDREELEKLVKAAKPL